MALTEEQIEKLVAKVAGEIYGTRYTNQELKLAKAIIAALPKPEAVEDFICRFKRHVGGDGEFWLHELEDFYTEAPIATPASEQKRLDEFNQELQKFARLCAFSDDAGTRIESANRLRQFVAPQPDYKAQRDAERYRLMCEYLIGPRSDLDDAIISCTSKNDMDGVIDAAIASVKGGE